MGMSGYEYINIGFQYGMICIFDNIINYVVDWDYLDSIMKGSFGFGFGNNWVFFWKWSIICLIRWD